MRKDKDTPKRKRDGSLTAVNEFMSPISLQECVRLLRAKRPVRRKNRTFECEVYEITPGTYHFTLLREQREDYRGRQRTVSSARVSGELHYWDESSTLVKLDYPRDYSIAYIIGGILVGLFIAATFEVPLQERLLLAIPLMLLGGTLVFFWYQMNQRQEVRKLVRLVEDMLGDPILV